jgi:hypothetical protein
VERQSAKINFKNPQNFFLQNFIRLKINKQF